MPEKDIEILKRDVQRILSYLCNDDDTGEKGLVASFGAHEREFKAFKVAYEKEQVAKKARMGVIGAVGGVLGTFLIWLGKILIEKL